MEKQPPIGHFLELPRGPDPKTEMNNIDMEIEKIHREEAAVQQQLEAVQTKRAGLIQRKEEIVRENRARLQH